MLWKTTIVRAVPWRACSRIATRATTVAPLRIARFYSQDPSGTHKPPTLQSSPVQAQQQKQGLEQAGDAVVAAASESTGASTDGTTPEAANYPPKEELTPLAKHIRDSIKVRSLAVFSGSQSSLYPSPLERIGRARLNTMFSLPFFSVRPSPTSTIFSS